MKTLTACILAAALTACAAQHRATDGSAWTYDATTQTWTDVIGYTTNVDPSIPLCRDVTLKKGITACVVRR